LLELQATTNSAAASSSLQYTWSYISTADQAAGLTPTFLPSSSSPQLQLDPSLLLPDTTYNFTVRVADVGHVDGSGVAPSSASSTAVRVLLVTQQVQTAAGVDPCSSNPSFQCLNGGRCVATETIPSSRNYTLTCACPTSPVQFLGAKCGFALLECPNGNALYAGGADIALYGIGFNTLRRIMVAGRIVPFQNDAAFNSSSNDAEWQGVLRRWPNYAGRVQRVRFIAPALVTVNRTTAAAAPSLLSTSTEGTTDAAVVNPPAAYQTLTLSSLLLADGSGSGKLLETNISNILYYSSSTCRNEGQWKEDGTGGCLPCPEGAFWSVCKTKRDWYFSVGVVCGSLSPHVFLVFLSHSPTTVLAPDAHGHCPVTGLRKRCHSAHGPPKENARLAHSYSLLHCVLVCAFLAQELVRVSGTHQMRGRGGLSWLHQRAQQWSDQFCGHADLCGWL
jgi:hypothetical protein